MRFSSKLYKIIILNREPEGDDLHIGEFPLKGMDKPAGETTLPGIFSPLVKRRLLKKTNKRMSRGEAKFRPLWVDPLIHGLVNMGAIRKSCFPCKNSGLSTKYIPIYEGPVYYYYFFFISA